MTWDILNLTWIIISSFRITESKSYIFALLKFIAFILAAYVLCCSVIPCCVDDNCADEMTSSARSHPQDDDCKGNCSPFFACGTCAGFSVNVQSFELAPVLFDDHSTYSSFYICSRSEYFPTFWQPPKLAGKNVDILV